MATKEVAIKKRAQIDQATQIMLIAVGAASIVLGCATVFSVYLFKWIIFNSKVIGEKSLVIEDYKTIQTNVEKLAGQVDALADNEYLEVVARVRADRCQSVEEGLIDIRENIELARICSALRVIPDALPAVQNDEAVYASLNKLFLETSDESGQPVIPESISPGSGFATSDQSLLEIGISTIPVNLMIENTAITTRAFLDTVERSIRNYDIQTAVIEWRSNSPDDNSLDVIELRGNASAYYSGAIQAEQKRKTIYADDSKAAATPQEGIVE